MRLVLVDSAPLTFSGGYERFVIALAGAAASAGHDARVITPTTAMAAAISYATTARRLPALQDPDQVRAELHHAVWSTAGPVTLARHLHWADVVYVKNEPQELLTVVPIRGNAGLVTGLHSATGPQPQRWTGAVRHRLYGSRLYAAALRQSDVIHTLTPDSSRWVTATTGVPRSRLAEIPNGIDLRAFRPRDFIEGGPLRLLFAGRLIRQKGADTFADAMQILTSRGLGARVVATVAGDGPLLDYVRRRAGERAVVRPFQPPASMPKVYAEHHLVVMPSRWETFGLVAAEALACGRPVIVSSIPAFVPFHSGSLSVVPAGEAPALAGALENAIRMWESQRREFERIGSLGRTTAEREFDELRQRERLLQVFERVARRRRRAA